MNLTKQEQTSEIDWRINAYLEKQIELYRKMLVQWVLVTPMPDHVRKIEIDIKLIEHELDKIKTGKVK